MPDDDEEFDEPDVEVVVVELLLLVVPLVDTVALLPVELDMTMLV